MVIYIVINCYQGIHYFAETEEGARRYILDKVERATPNSCWVEEAWEIVEQPINSMSVGGDWYGN